MAIFHTASSYGLGGSGIRNAGDIQSQEVPWHGREQSITLTLPSLSTLFFRVKGQAGAGYIAPEKEGITEVKGREEKEPSKVSTEAAETGSGRKTRSA